MKPVQITELRQKLPQYLARVRRGERLLVTSRGKPVAEIAPVRASADTAQKARERLRGSVASYERALDPAFEPGEWEADR
ncbi:MAG: type II toxin-antitoxin system prevent-host-death family antitoxin [Burkholderiales bacterium]|nr:type II toxin-antitoxin system prevent-host-death family antitoxin [Burkholderiales bacterium]